MALSSVEVLHTEDESMSTPEPGLRRQVMSYSPGMMLVRHRMTKGWVGARHSHPHEQMVYIVSGHLTLQHPGGVSRQPRETASWFQAMSNIRLRHRRTPRFWTSSLHTAKTTPEGISALNRKETFSHGGDCPFQSTGGLAGRLQLNPKELVPPVALQLCVLQRNRVDARSQEIGVEGNQGRRRALRGSQCELAFAVLRYATCGDQVQGDVWYRRGQEVTVADL